MQWRFLFFELNGDGTETFLRGDVPVLSPSPTRKLSTPHQISGVLTPAAVDLITHDEERLLRRWKTTVYVADESDHIWVGGILVDYSIDGPDLSFDVAGFTAMPKEQPYEGEYDEVQVDPLDVYRHIWSHLQSRNGNNLGLVLDDTTSPVRIGELKILEPETATELPKVERNGVKLNWFETFDLGAELDKLASETPFDYLEEHSWNADKTAIEHRLRLGYPTLGNRLTAPRFVLGENVWAIPSENYSSEDVVTEIWFFGAGEGRDRVVASAAITPRDSIRRVRIVNDKLVTTRDQALTRARQELMGFQPDMPGAGITQLLVRNHSNAPFKTFDVGDEITYSGDHQWGEVVIWVKIVSIQLAPTGDMVLSVIRSDTLTS